MLHRQCWWFWPRYIIYSSSVHVGCLSLRSFSRYWCFNHFYPWTTAFSHCCEPHALLLYWIVDGDIIHILYFSQCFQYLASFPCPKIPCCLHSSMYSPFFFTAIFPSWFYCSWWQVSIVKVIHFWLKLSTQGLGILYLPGKLNQLISKVEICRLIQKTFFVSPTIPYPHPSFPLPLPLLQHYVHFSSPPFYFPCSSQVFPIC